MVLLDVTKKGGGERVAIHLANALSEIQDFNVHIISFFRKDEAPVYPLSQRVRLDFLCNFQESSFFFLRFFHRHIYRFILNFKARPLMVDCDVVLANDRSLMQCLKFSDKRYIRLWHLRYKKKDLGFFDDVVILSDREKYKWDQIHKKVSVIPNFLPDFPLIHQSRQKIILAVGSFSQYKGFMELIDMYARIARRFPEWKLKIIGEGPQKSLMQRSIQNLDMQDFIELVPFMSNIETAYSMASIFVSSSLSEGFSMVLLEASSCGIPCVSFDIDTGPSDIILDLQSGFLIPPRDFDAFCSKLVSLMEDDELRARMGEVARRYVREKFHKERIVKMWKGLLDSREL